MSSTLSLRPVADSDHDPDRGPQRTVLAMVAVMLLFVGVAFAWAYYAKLDVAAQGRGTVVVSSKLQEVQSLEGGIVKEMLVAVGQRVKAGEVVAKLDTAQAAADLGESRQQQMAALASRARVDALLSGAAPQFDERLRRDAPELVERETQLWRDGQREQRSAVTASQEGVLRRRSELAEANARIAALRPSLKVADEAFAIEERLYGEGASARADMLAAQQRLLLQRNEIDALQQSLPRLRAGLAEAQAQGAEAESRLRTQWGGQRSEYQTKASTLAATIGGRQDRAERRDVLAPVDGVVNRVLVNTLGSVAAPGKTIMEIVPDDPNLLMTVRVKPADIAFIRPGQTAHVRVLSYDPATYGQMAADVRRVGADAVVDEKGEPYFEVQLIAARDQLKLHGKALPVTPGMPVEVGILTGQRSVMQYLLKPVLRGIQGALQER